MLRDQNVEDTSVILKDPFKEGLTPENNPSPYVLLGHMDVT